MKIAVGCDHEGYRYKEKIKQYLAGKGHDVEDFGTNSTEPCDYPDFVRPAAQAVAEGRCDRAIVLGGSGNGEAMAANKVRGVRCALCWNSTTARLSRQHNNANVLTLGAGLLGMNQVELIARTWLETEFGGGRHARRVEKILGIEQKYFK